MFTLTLRRRRWTLRHAGLVIGIYPTLGGAVAARLAVHLETTK